MSQRSGFGLERVDALSDEHIRATIDYLDRVRLISP
jgi:hypothetical protein